jgi:hypothetical protein
MTKKLVKISYYITVEFSKQGIVIASLQASNKGVHLFDFELDMIYREYKKWKQDT